MRISSTFLSLTALAIVFGGSLQAQRAQAFGSVAVEGLSAEHDLGGLTRGVALQISPVLTSLGLRFATRPVAGSSPLVVAVILHLLWSRSKNLGVAEGRARAPSPRGTLSLQQLPASPLGSQHLLGRIWSEEVDPSARPLSAFAAPLGGSDGWEAPH